jgi:hypothetical protein
MTTNYLLTSTPATASENLEVIKRTQRATAENFIDASVAMFWLRDLKQYKELGFDRLEMFLDSQGIEVSKAQFHAMANLGSALRWINTTRDELVAVGYSAMIEIIRLARTKDGAEKHKNDIARLITRKAKGLIDVKTVRDAVKSLLGEGKVQASAAPNAPALPYPSGSDDTANISEPESSDWRTKYRSMLGSAHDEADFIARIREMLGE